MWLWLMKILTQHYQLEQPGDQILNQKNSATWSVATKFRNVASLVAKFVTNASGATRWPNLLRLPEAEQVQKLTLYLELSLLRLQVKWKQAVKRTWDAECQNIGISWVWSWVVQSLIISREGLILTLSILPCPQGRISWSTPCRKIDAERLSVLHQNDALQISLDPRIQSFQVQLRYS